MTGINPQFPYNLKEIIYYFCLTRLTKKIFKKFDSIEDAVGNKPVIKDVKPDKQINIRIEKVIRNLYYLLFILNSTPIKPGLYHSYRVWF